ncbi:hypothetical protein SASPL_157580 [Salvia splendens]|uniref:Uncharacterized protein n=1 Tax=Salvia splendens TaxID=180675 RepID=A0A8X8YV79_SALSN|nr:hypothetical protein SASPL_157580 [Salvia splendens]
MEPAVRKRGGGAWEGMYRLVMRRTPVYVTFVLVGAFVGERVRISYLDLNIAMLILCLCLRVCGSWIELDLRNWPLIVEFTLYGNTSTLGNAMRIFRFWVRDSPTSEDNDEQSAPGILFFSIA